MRTFLLIAVLILSLHAQAQTPPFDFTVNKRRPPYVSFRGDTSEPNVNGSYDRMLEDDRLLDSAYGLGKNYEFEFRLWERHFHSNDNTVFILTLKNNQWTARYFAHDIRRPNGIAYSEQPVDQSKVYQLWELLVQNDVLTLPDKGVLQDRLVLYRVDTTNLQKSGGIITKRMDGGPVYGFELRAPTKKRFYSYADPYTDLKQFGNIKELYHATVIILLIQKFLGKPLRVS